MELLRGEQYLYGTAPVELVDTGIGGISCVKHADGELDIVHNKNLSPVAEPTVTIAPTNPLACNLATKMAWLEGLSVVSECTGEQYCTVSRPWGFPDVKYDPIGRPAIIMELVRKYKVDLDWMHCGGCATYVYNFMPDSTCLSAQETTRDHNGCFATTVLTVILEAQS